MAHQYQKISGRDLEIFYRHMMGMANKDIAVDLNLSEGTISQKINSDWFRHEKAKVHAMTVSAITSGKYSPLTIARANAVKMMQLNLGIAEGGKIEANRLRAIHDILDRAMGKAVQRSAVVDDPSADFERMTADELDRYAESGELPEWAKDGPLGGGGTVH